MDKKEKPTDEELEITDFDAFMRGDYDKDNTTDLDELNESFKKNKKGSEKPTDEQLEDKFNGAELSIWLFCPHEPDTPKARKWIEEYMNTPNINGERPIDSCPYDKGTKEYDEWVMNYKVKPIEAYTADKDKGLNDGKDIFSRGDGEILDKTKISVRPIDYCSCVPGTEEYKKWIMDYMTKPNEMGVRPIDYCPCVPGTKEYDKWIMDYMTKPINENTRNINPKSAAESALKKIDYETVVSAKAVEDQELTKELEGVDLGDND